MAEDMAARKALPVGHQIRTYPASYEVRTLGGKKVEISGYASTTETPYSMHDSYGAYTEVVRAGAFTKTIGENADVAFLTNHGGLTMARTSSGSLRLSEDSTGLHAAASLNTARSDVSDLVTAIEDGEIDEMSFAFQVMRQAWSPDYDERALVELNLNRGDVSAVNYGANPTTSIGMRAFRTRRSLDLHRISLDLRAGKTLSTATMSTLAAVLDLIASADVAVDAAQPMLADLMGVPDPDADESPASMAAAEQLNAAVLDMLRRREQHRRERPRFRAS